MQLHQIGVQILHILKLSPAILAHGHDIAHILVGSDDIHLHIGFLGVLNGAGIGIVVGVIHLHHGAVGLVDVVDDGGQRGDQVQVEFPLQPLLDDLHMEHSQKAAAEAKAQRHGGFGLKGKGGVIELQLFQGVTKIGILGAVLGIDAAVHHGLDPPVAGQGLGGGIHGVGYGIAHPGIRHVFDGGSEIAHLTGL